MRYLLTKDAAQRLSVSERTVRIWEAAGKLKAIRAGRVRLFDAAQVERLARERSDKLAEPTTT